jgi:hypothetical protein
MVPEPLNPLLRFLMCLPHHDLVLLFDAMELAVEQLRFEDVEEKALVENFMTNFWIATKRNNDK